MLVMTEVEERPAPDRLELIRAFVNTRDIDLQTEALTSPEELRRWLAEHDLLAAGERVTAGDLRSALAVREAFRALLVANAADEPPPADAIGVLNAASTEYGLAPRLDGGGRSAIVTPARGAQRALATLLAVMHEEIAARPLDPPEGVRRGVVPLGVLRHEPQPLVALVPHGRVRQPQQEPRVLRAPARAGRAAAR